MEPAFLPNRAAMRDHLSRLTDVEREALPDLRVEIAWGDPDEGPSHARTYRIDEIEAAAGFAAWINARGCNVYVGATLKAIDAPPKGRTSIGHAVLATSLPIDIDGDFVAAACKLASIAKPQLVVITGLQPQIRGQLWIRIKPTDDMATWAEVNRRSVAFSGGDRNALGAHRLMRLGGSLSHPSLKKQARGYVIERTSLRMLNTQAYDLRELLERFPAVEPESLPAASKQSHTRRTTRHERLPVNRTNVALVQSMLDALPAEYAENYAPWLHTGFALHDFDENEVGLALWRKFSARCPDKAESTDFESLWAGFDRTYEGKKISLGWLRWRAQTHGWRPACRWDRSTNISA